MIMCVCVCVCCCSGVANCCRGPGENERSRGSSCQGSAEKSNCCTSKERTSESSYLTACSCSLVYWPFHLCYFLLQFLPSVLVFSFLFLFSLHFFSFCFYLTIFLFFSSLRTTWQSLRMMTSLEAESASLREEVQHARLQSEENNRQVLYCTVLYRTVTHCWSYRIIPNHTA